MKIEDLKNKTNEELLKTLLELKKEQMELRFQLSAGQLEDTSKSLKVRRDIARVRTAMNNKDKAA
jgi:large subunit ribosomal protein L29